MEDNDTFVRIKDREARDMLRKLAAGDMRTLGSQVAWLIREEFARRYSRANPLVTVGEAIQAAEPPVEIQG